MYTLHEMRPTGDGEWEYVQKRVRKEAGESGPIQEANIDGMWEVNTDPEEEACAEVEVTVPLINGDVAAIKRLSAQESEKNLGLRVQPDGNCETQLKVKREQAEEWTGHVKTGNLPARTV